MEFDERFEELTYKMSGLWGDLHKRWGEHSLKNLKVCGRIRNLIDEMEALEKRTVEMENADIATKIKFSRKAKKSGKEFWRLVREINTLHEKGDMREDHANLFGDSLKKLKARKFNDARGDLRHFKTLEDLYRELDSVSDGIRDLGKEIDSRINSLSEMLLDMHSIESLDELEMKAGAYEEASIVLKQYDRWREKQVARFKKTPAETLIKACSEGVLFDMGFPKPKDDISFGELGDYLSSSGIDGSPKEILRMADLDVRNLKKIIDDQHMFMRLVNENADWLESAAELERSEFLKFNLGDGARTERILSAITASGDNELLEAMQKMKSLPRDDFEDGRDAVHSIERVRAAKEKYKDVDVGSIESEMAALRNVKDKMDRVSGQYNQNTLEKGVLYKK
ncbi:MAG: hypothetical protein ABIG39_05420 [Candidatus Micrarchaeota archaeon]